MREQDAAFVIALFDGGADDAGDADTVAAHDNSASLALFIEHRGAKRFGIFGAEFEDVADFDTATEIERAFGIRAGVADDDVADIRHQIGFGQVASPVDTGGVEFRLVGAADEVGHGGDGTVGDDANLAAVKSDRAKEAGRAIERGADLRLGGEAEVG